MNLTRVRATIVAGMLASSMVLPGMTVMAKDATTGAVAEASIKKTVTVAPGVTSIPTADSTVTFTVDQAANASGIVAPNVQQGGSLLTGNTATVDVSTASAANNEFAQEILTGAGIDLTDYGVGEYTFEIKEQTSSLNLAGTESSFGWSVVDSSTYYLRVLIKNETSGGTSTMYFITDSNDANAYSQIGHKLDNAAFANTYNKKSTDDGTPSGAANTLTVTKQVIHPEYVSSSNEYDVKVTVQLPETQRDKDGTYFAAAGDYTATISGAVNGCTAEVTKGDLDTTAGTIEYTVSLHDGESIVISDLAEGATYSVEETNRSEFQNLDKTLYKVDGDMTGTNDCASQTFDSDSSTVIVENTFKDVTATGVVTSVAPYITLVAVAAAGIAGYMVLKRRVAR